MRRVLKGGIIGCGFFSQFQIEAWRRIPEVELVAACDLDLARASKAAANAYSSPQAMLDQEPLDFVDIATRSESHLELVTLAAQRKLAIVCQKPMAPTWQECVAMVKVAEHHGSPLMIHENWRWQPWYRAAKELIGEGLVGGVLSYRMRSIKRDGFGPAPYPDQPYFREMPRFLIYETLVHNLDTSRFLFGEITDLYARTRRVNPRISGEDEAVILTSHASGVEGIIEGSRFISSNPLLSPVLGDAVFHGKEDSLILPGDGQLFLASGALVWKNTITGGYRGDSVFATQRHFVDCLLQGHSMESSGRAYLNAVNLVESAYRSAHLDSPVRVQNP